MLSQGEAPSATIGQRQRIAIARAFLTWYEHGTHKYNPTSPLLAISGKILRCTLYCCLFRSTGELKGSHQGMDGLRLFYGSNRSLH